MEFKKIISSILFATVSSSVFALTHSEISTLINQQAKQFSHYIRYQPKQKYILNWSALSGPVLGTVFVKQMVHNPDMLFAFNKHSNSLVYKSIDAGQHWKVLPIKSNDNLSDLISLDENRLLLSAGSKIYSSDDQGEHWQLANNLGQYGYQFFSPNPNLVFLEVNRMHTSSNLYRSLDGGKSWQPATLGFETSLAIESINGLDHLSFVYILDGGLYMSSNQGALWTQNEKWKENHSQMIYSIGINSKYDIYLATGHIYKTDLLGKTWDQIDKGLAGRIESIAINKQNQIFALGDQLYRSNDDGRTWETIYNAAIDNFTLLDNGKIIANTMDGLMMSDTHQQHFSKLPTPFSMSDVSNVFALDKENFFAVDRISGLLYRSSDGGQSWQIAIEKKRVFDIADFDKQLIVLAQGEIGTQEILVSKDKGVSWQMARRFDELCTKISSDNNGLLVFCYKGHFFTDDLSTWKKFDNGSDNDRFHGYFDGQSIYISDGDSIKQTRDQGKTWMTVIDNLHHYSTYLSGFRDKVVLVAIYDGGIIKITNHGASLEIINNGLTDFDFTSIKALDENHYFASTDNGIFYTQDGGAHWVSENYGLINLDVKSLFVDSSFLLAGTKGSGVYKAVLNP